MFKSVAELKRSLKVGTGITTISHDHYPHGGLIGVRRTISVVQHNGIGITDPNNPTGTGSWLHWPPAKEIKLTDRGFRIALDLKKDAWMEYVVEVDQ